GATLAILWYARHYPKDYEQWPIMCKHALTRALFLTVTLAIFHRIKQSRALRQQLLLGLCALGLIWLDGLTHLPRQNPTVPPSILASSLPVFLKLVPLPIPADSGAMRVAPARRSFQRALLPAVANTT